MNNISNSADSLWAGFMTGFNSFMNFIPSLLGAAIILAIGWLISSAVARLVEKLLVTLKFESAVSRTGLTGYLPQLSEGHPKASGFLALLTKWFIRLIFIQAAANILNMPQVTLIINNILLYIPNVAVAVLILVGGTMLANFISRLVESSVTKMGVSRPGVFAMISRYAIVGFAVIASVNQLGIATNLINILFVGLVGSISLALGLAFGLGGQGVASEVTRSFYENGKTTTARLRSVPGEKKVL